MYPSKHSPTVKAQLKWKEVALGPAVPLESGGRCQRLATGGSTFAQAVPLASYSEHRRSALRESMYSSLNGIGRIMVTLGPNASGFMY